MIEYLMYFLLEEEKKSLIAGNTCTLEHIMYDFSNKSSNGDLINE